MALKISRDRNDEKRTYWQKEFDKFKTSGLSQKEFCAREGLCLSSFTRWKNKPRTPGKQSQFVELKHNVHTSKSTKIEVMIGEKIKLVVEENIGIEKLRGIVNALQEIS